MNPIVDAMSNRNKGHIIMDGDGKTAFPDCESSGRMRAYLDETNDDTRDDWGVLGYSLYWGGTPHSKVGFARGAAAECSWAQQALAARVTNGSMSAGPMPTVHV